MESWTALSPVVFVCVLAWYAASKWTQDWAFKVFALLAAINTSVPLCAELFDRQFLPQPGRYKLELDLAWSLLLPFLILPLWRRMPRTIALTAALVVVALGAEQVVSHRRFAKETMRPADVTRTIEYRVAQWVQQNLPHERVFLPGTLAMWFNAFSDGEQVTGSSWSTAYSPVQQQVQRAVFEGTDVRHSILWLQAFGAGAVAVVGPHSDEFWKPYSHPEKFQGALQPLWSERDTTIYRVPTRSTSYAHVIPAGMLVQGQPDEQQLARFVEAINDPSKPSATWHWQGDGRAETVAQLGASDVVALQLTFAPGWRATVNGRPMQLKKDGLGLMYLAPQHAGLSHIELRFVGSWEEWLLRVPSYVGLAIVIGYLVLEAARTRRARSVNAT